ncbi:MAG: transferase, partial [bacterium]|nr:transferase [bacterium]
MKLVIFEDQTFECFYPLTYLRPVFELRCGASSLAEKIVAGQSPDTAAYFVRDVLRDTFLQRHEGAVVNDLAAIREDDCLIVNGRILLSK